MVVETGVERVVENAWVYHRSPATPVLHTSVDDDSDDVDDDGVDDGDDKEEDGTRNALNKSLPSPCSLSHPVSYSTASLCFTTKIKN